MNSKQSEQLKVALEQIAGMADTGRESVTECVTTLRQIDVDAAAAVTRGHFLAIAALAKAALHSTE